MEHHSSLLNSLCPFELPCTSLILTQQMSFFIKYPLFLKKSIKKKSPHECSVIFGHCSQRLWKLTVVFQPVNLDPEKDQTPGDPPWQACAWLWLSDNTIWRKQTLSLHFNSLLWTSVLPYSSCVSPFAEWPWVSCLASWLCAHALREAPHGVLVANKCPATPCSGN